MSSTSGASALDAGVRTVPSSAMPVSKAVASALDGAVTSNVLFVSAVSAEATTRVPHTRFTYKVPKEG